MKYSHVTKQVIKQSLISLSIVAAVAGFSTSIIAQAADLPNGRANNPVPTGDKICNLDIGFIVDRSNSIRNDSEANPAIITNSISSVVDGLQGTDSKVAVWSFGTKATGYTGVNPLPDSPVITAADYPGIGFTSVKTAQGAQAVKSTVARIPYESEKSPANLRRAGWTNWQAALSESVANGDRPSDADIVFIVTDGDPTVPHDPADPTSLDHSIAIKAGVQAADAVKSNGRTRIVALGVGQVATDGMFVNNLKRLSGGLNGAQANKDYFTGNFSNLGSMLKEAIAQACEPAEKPEVPITPVATLPNTGPAGVLAAFGGVSAIAATAHAAVTRRLRK